MVLVAGTQIITRPVSVTASPAHLEFDDLRFKVDHNANLVLTAEAKDVGSSPYQGELALKVDGQVLPDSQSVSLPAGREAERTV